MPVSESLKLVTHDIFQQIF